MGKMKIIRYGPYVKNGIDGDKKVWAIRKSGNNADNKVWAVHI